MRVVVRMGMAVLMGWASLLVGYASPKQVEEGVWVEDFEDGKLDGWKVEADHAVVETENGNRVLELGDRELGEQKLWFLAKKFTDFSIEARVRRQIDNRNANVGFIFRGNCRVYFRKPGRLTLEGPPGSRKIARSLKRSMNTVKYRRLKLVCAGPIVRVYIDDKFTCQLTNIPVVESPVALFGRNRRVYIDDVKITTKVDPGQYVAVEVKAPDERLVFSPAENVRLRFKVNNYSDAEREVVFGVSVESWEAGVIKQPVFKVLTLPAKAERMVDFELGRLPEGFHRIVLHPSLRYLPLAIHDRPEPVKEPPDLILAVYWYYQHWTLPPVWKNTYACAASYDLRKHNFNTIVTMIGTPTDQLDIYREYGLWAVTRGSNLEHPAVIGSLVGDEPHTEEEIDRLKQEYLKRRKINDKIVTTNIICDGGVSEFQRKAWEELVPIGGVRLCRWYNIKKSWFGPGRRYPGRVTLVELLRELRKDPSPFWILVNTGGTGPKAYFALPSAGQIKSALHLVFASGAEGFVVYCYQDWGPGSLGFVKNPSLVPNGESWSAAGEAAGKVLRHAKLLKSLKPAGSLPWWDNRAVEVVSLTDSEGEDRYFYLINTDPRETVSCMLFNLGSGAILEDLFSGKSFEVEKETIELLGGSTVETGAVHMKLKPGEGRLLKYIPPTPKLAQKVKLPDWVKRVPEGKCLYLIKLEPLNFPRPDWIPGPKKRIKLKPWVTLNGDQKLYSSMSDPGTLYRNSLYAQAETEIVYELPPGYTHFVAVGGFGARSKRGSVIFRVIVDGKEKYNSGVYRIGPLLPIVVDVKGAKKLELVTEEAGDGIYDDYVWWGSARLIKGE